MIEFADALRDAKDIYDVQPWMGPEYEGVKDGYSSCPCFTIDEADFRAVGHCWRASCDDHSYDSRKTDGRCCVHVWGSQELGSKLRALLDAADWYGGWALEFESLPVPA